MCLDVWLRRLTELGEEYPYNEEALSDRGLFTEVPKEVRILTLSYFAKICKVCGFLCAEINKDSVDSLREGLEGTILPGALKKDLIGILQKAGEIKSSFKVPIKDKEFRRRFASVLSSWSKKPRDFWLGKDILEELLFNALQVEIKDSQVRSLLIQIFLDRDEVFVKFAKQALSYFGTDHSFVINRHAVFFGTKPWEGKYPHVENYLFRELNLPKMEVEIGLVTGFLEDPRNTFKFISTTPENFAKVFGDKEPMVISFLKRIRQDLWILGLDIEIKEGMIIKLGTATRKKISEISYSWMIGIFFEESGHGKWQSFAIPRDRYFELDKSRLEITHWWPNIKRWSKTSS